MIAKSEEEEGEGGCAIPVSHRRNGVEEAQQLHRETERRYLAKNKGEREADFFASAPPTSLLARLSLPPSPYLSKALVGTGGGLI